MRFRFGFALSALLATLTFSTSAQVTPAVHGSQATVALNPDLLPTSAGSWNPFAAQDSASSTGAPVSQPAFLANANRAALAECGPQRSVSRYYQAGSRTVGVTAIEFKDASGALAAFSILSQPEMREVKGLGERAVAGQGAVLFVTGAAVAVASPASDSDVPALQALASVMPKVVGSKALQPLLPSLLPSRGLVPGSVRYAFGPRSYMAEGGVLPAAGLGWDKDAEAVTAKYSDRRGIETLTLLLYPTPTIAGPHLRLLEGQLGGLGPSFAKAKSRREGALLAVANGTFFAEAAQNLVENSHLRQLASTDKAMVTPDVVETRQTFGLLANVIIFSGVLALAALVLAIFLGGGRALIRIMRGKPPATELEFLSLHLDPQNPTPVFSKE